MLEGTTVLPRGALTAADAKRLRAREEVEMLVRLDSPEEMDRRGGAHDALLLVEGTLLAVTYTSEGWTQQVRRENAERVDLLDAVMQHLAERRGSDEHARPSSPRSTSSNGGTDRSGREKR